MIFTKITDGDDFLIVCGSFWPGAKQGAPMPHGWPDHWRRDQPGYHLADEPCPLIDAATGEAP